MVTASAVINAQSTRSKITRCDHHILQFYLLDRPEVHYNLRERHHNKVLILSA